MRQCCVLSSDHGVNVVIITIGRGPPTAVVRVLPLPITAALGPQKHPAATFTATIRLIQEAA